MFEIVRVSNSKRCVCIEVLVLKWEGMFRNYNYTLCKDNAKK